MDNPHAHEGAAAGDVRAMLMELPAGDLIPEPEVTTMPAAAGEAREWARGRREVLEWTKAVLPLTTVRSFGETVRRLVESGNAHRVGSRIPGYPGTLPLPPNLYWARHDGMQDVLGWIADLLESA